MPNRKIMFYGEGIRLTTGEPLRFRIPSTISPRTLRILEEHICITSLRTGETEKPLYIRRAPSDLGMPVSRAKRLPEPKVVQLPDDLRGATFGSLAPAEYSRPRLGVSSFASRMDANFGFVIDHPIIDLMRKLSDLSSVRDAYNKLGAWLQKL